jgi:carbamoyltransferase
MPHEAIRFILREAGLEFGDLDFIATNWDARARSNLFYARQAAGFLYRNSYSWNAIPLLILTAASHHRRSFTYHFGDRVPPVRPVRHHLAHLGSCYTVSGFDSAAVAIIDGSGEWECTSLYHCRGRDVKKLYSMDLPLDSLGHLYLCATKHLGYTMGDEYKVMGMSAYGEPNAAYERFFEECVVLQPEGRYRINSALVGNYFDRGFRFPQHIQTRIGKPRSSAEPLEQHHMDFARALQSRLEDAVLHVTRHLRKITGERRLCMAGGVALNCLANSRVREESGFDELFIQPAAHDGGAALGAAAYLQYHVLHGPRPEPMRSAYLGPSYDTTAISALLERCGCPGARPRDVADAAARLLADGSVLGWFQGRAEFGPRALGNRSILADPRRAEMKDRVNQAVKEREGYRPFAPAILAEAVSEYFSGITESPYMLLTGNVRPERRAEIAAVTHADGTARLQTVTRAANPLFHRLIERFAELTGTPVLLNTSFNVAGEPIVLTPADALRCYSASGLDALAIGEFLLEKRGAYEAAPARASVVSSAKLATADLANPLAKTANGSHDSQ